MPAAKKQPYKAKSDYGEASPVVVTRADGSRAQAPPLTPEAHEAVVKGRRSTRKTRWRDVSKLPPIEERIATARAEVAACREVLAATQRDRDASATAEFKLRGAQAALAALLLEQQGAA